MTTPDRKPIHTPVRAQVLAMVRDNPPLTVDYGQVCAGVIVRVSARSNAPKSDKPHWRRTWRPGCLAAQLTSEHCFALNHLARSGLIELDHDQAFVEYGPTWSDNPRWSRALVRVRLTPAGTVQLRRWNAKARPR